MTKHALDIVLQNMKMDFTSINERTIKQRMKVAECIRQLNMNNKKCKAAVKDMVSLRNNDDDNATLPDIRQKMFNYIFALRLQKRLSHKTMKNMILLDDCMKNCNSQIHTIYNLESAVKEKSLKRSQPTTEGSKRIKK